MYRNKVNRNISFICHWKWRQHNSRTLTCQKLELCDHRGNKSRPKKDKVFTIPNDECSERFVQSNIC